LGLPRRCAPRNDACYHLNKKRSNKQEMLQFHSCLPIQYGAARKMAWHGISNFYFDCHNISPSAFFMTYLPSIMSV
jgi:hypothetical protein